MNINSIAVLLGCAGLLVGGIGIVAQGKGQQSADIGTVPSARAAWPPHALVAGVEFYDEMVELLTLGSQPRRRAEVPQQQTQTVSQQQMQAGPQQQTQGVPPEGEANIRLIRTLRFPGSRRTQLVEIEFVDPGGRAYLRRYPVQQQVFAADDPRSEFEADRSALETYGYSPRRSRRYGRGYYRRRW